MSNPARILANLRKRPLELRFSDLEVLLFHLGWSKRDAKGSHWKFTSPRGYTISVPKDKNMVKRCYLELIRKEIDRGEGA